MQTRLFSKVRRYDWYIIGAVATLFFFGIAGLYSVKLADPNISWFAAIRSQTLFFIIGIIGLVCVSMVNYFTTRAYVSLLYALGIIALVVLLFLAPEIRGIKGWFVLFGFTIQPIEFVKIIVLITLAHFFALHNQRNATWKTLILSVCIVGIPFGLTLLQPDLGSGLVLLGLYGVFLLSLRFDRRKILLILGTLFITIVCAWFFLLADYQKNRIFVLFNPALDPLGVGYNTSQSLVAIGSGGILGKGLGNGTQAQLKFLPEVEDDFIFSVIAEELGLWGVMLIIICVTVIVYRLLVAVRYEQNLFGQYILMGYAAIIFTQTFINIGMNLGVLPVIGIPLPFISSGGSSMIALLMGMGLVQSVIVNQKA